MLGTLRLSAKCITVFIGLVCLTVPSAIADSVQQQLTLREGTEVALEFEQNVSSATAEEDDKVNFRLADDLKIGEVPVAKAGAIAVGTVTHAQKRGHLGKAGELNIRMDYMKVGDTRVRLRAAKGKEGDSKIGATVALTVLFGPIGLLKRGHDIDIKKGAKLTAWVEQDTQVSALQETQPVRAPESHHAQTKDATAKPPKR